MENSNSATNMGTPPRPPANDGFERFTADGRSLLPSTSEPTNLPSGDRPATPADVLQALTYRLELVHHGALLVAKRGRSQLAKRAALSILRRKDGISLAHTGLVADRASDTRLLHKLLEEAIQAPQSGEPKESPVILERKSAHSALMVRIMPGPGLACWQGTEQETALMKLYDQDQGLVVNEKALISVYGITRSEAAR